MKNQRLYNVFFPIWMLILFPQMWLVTVPANFIIDSLVILLGAHYVVRGRAREIWKKSILKVFIFGFLSDFVGSGFLFGGLYLASFSENPFLNSIFENTVNGPESIGGFFGLLAAAVISAVCIYFADYKISFKNLDIEDAQKKKLALIMAIATAPYTFFVPLYW